MEAPLLQRGGRRLLSSCLHSTRPAGGRVGSCQQRRWLATPVDGPVRAAAPIQFSNDRDQFARRGPSERAHILGRIRVVPASPSYFTATPKYTDDLLHLISLLRQYQHLPVCPSGTAPRIAWKTYQQYLDEINEPVRQTRFARLFRVIRRLNNIYTPLLPGEVQTALDRFKRAVQPQSKSTKIRIIDRWGRSRGVGRRKTSSAQCWVVEGEGEVLVNGRSLTEYFNRNNDRENAVWALKATERLDKYNVWAIVQGGGTTGQAEAMTYGVAKALIAQEPALLPALRKSGCLSHDPRQVERKKPGHIKARKMPTWVKR